MSIKLGSKVRCKVTGLSGIATCRSEFLNGCFRIGIQPPVDKDGKMVESYYVDEPQVEVVEEDVCQKTSPETGGPVTMPRESSPK